MRQSLQLTQVAQVVQLNQDGTSNGALPGNKASTFRDVEKAVGGQQPSSRTATSAFVQGGIGEALREPCKMTSSRPQVCMHLLKRSETDSMRVVRNRLHEGGMRATGGGCAYSSTPCRTFDIYQRTPRLANLPLAPIALHRWKQVHTDHMWQSPWRTLCCLQHPPAWPVWQWVSNGVGWH